MGSGARGRNQLMRGLRPFAFRPGRPSIRDVLVVSGNPDVTLEVIPGADHAYAFAKDKRESYDNYKTRNFRGNPESIRRVTEWLARHRD